MTTTPDGLDQAISRIVEAWRRAHAGHDDLRTARARARLGAGWGDLRRYRAFLGFALQDREHWGAEVVRNIEAQQALAEGRADHRTLDTDELELMVKGGDLSDRLHYALESFYVFGKVLLDRVARAVEATFGNAQGIGLSSHGDLHRQSKGLIAYAAAHAIEAPPVALLERARNLEETLARFRDNGLVHPQNIRVRYATTWSLDTGDTDLMPVVLYATEGENEAGPVQAPKVNDLAADIDAYLEIVVAWVEACLTRNT